MQNTYIDKLWWNVMFSLGDIIPKSKANDHIYDFWMLKKSSTGEKIQKQRFFFFFASVTWLIISSIRADKKNQKIDNHNEVFMW